MARDWEQVTGQPTPSALSRLQPRTRRVRRALRRGPRVQPHRARGHAAAPAESGEPQAGGLAEWHHLTPGEQVAAWASLRAWVTWLSDRYELSVEDRLPRCWPQHPGLVEELSALKAWREEIYCAAQPSGQSARYWHSELRQVLHAAATQYALGCRTGHRGAPSLAAADPALLGTWAAADPLARIPAAELTAGIARRTGDLASVAVIGAALDNDDAQPLPGHRDTLWYQDAWWTPASAGWTKGPRPERPGLPGTPSLWDSPPAGTAPSGQGNDPWRA